MRLKGKGIAPPGFEPGLTAPEAIVLTNYTMGLSINDWAEPFKYFQMLVTKIFKQPLTE